MKEMWKACFVYISFEDSCTTTPVTLLSRLNLVPLSLALYFLVVVIYGVGYFALRVKQSAVKCETHTKDKVFVNMVASIQYRDSTEKASETFYKLSNTRSQLQASVFDVIRSRVPKLNLDQAFKQNDDIAKTAESLKRTMKRYEP